MLPGVGYLEMAREALQRSLRVGPGSCVGLREVAWLQPLVVEGSREVHIRLQSAEAEEVEFEVYTRSAEGSEGEEIVHAQGRAGVVALGSGERKDLEELQRGARAHDRGRGAAMRPLRGWGLSMERPIGG